MSIDPLGDSNTFKPWLWLIPNSSNIINYRVVCDVENCCFPTILLSQMSKLENTTALLAKQIVAQILVIGAGPELAPITGTSGCAQWLSQRAWVSCLAMEWWVLSICQKASRCLSGKGLHVSCSLVPACAGFCAGWLLKGVCEFILVHIMYIYNCIKYKLYSYIDYRCRMYHNVSGSLLAPSMCRYISIPCRNTSFDWVAPNECCWSTWTRIMSWNTWARGMDFVYHILFAIPHIVLIIVYVYNIYILMLLYLLSITYHAWHRKHTFFESTARVAIFAKSKSVKHHRGHNLRSLRTAWTEHLLVQCSWVIS